MACSTEHLDCIVPFVILENLAGIEYVWKEPKTQFCSTWIDEATPHFAT